MRVRGEGGRVTGRVLGGAHRSSWRENVGRGMPGVFGHSLVVLALDVPQVTLLAHLAFEYQYKVAPCVCVRFGFIFHTALN